MSLRRELYRGRHSTPGDDPSLSLSASVASTPTPTPTPPTPARTVSPSPAPSPSGPLSHSQSHWARIWRDPGPTLHWAKTMTGTNKSPLPVLIPQETLAQWAYPPMPMAMAMAMPISEKRQLFASTGKQGEKKEPEPTPMPSVI
jgi:hypothetical protein